MESKQIKEILDQFEYYLIRLLLLALLVIGAYKLLEREIHGAEERPESLPTSARLTSDGMQNESIVNKP